MIADGEAYLLYLIYLRTLKPTPRKPIRNLSAPTPNHRDPVFLGWSAPRHRSKARSGLCSIHNDQSPYRMRCLNWPALLESSHPSPQQLRAAGTAIPEIIVLPAKAAASRCRDRVASTSCAMTLGLFGRAPRLHARLATPARWPARVSATLNPSVASSGREKQAAAILRLARAGQALHHQQLHSSCAQHLEEA